tara:strand:- start:68 stop:388 length:321 start_codon:yes stop_codon:yes gene_type:complete
MKNCKISLIFGEFSLLRSDNKPSIKIKKKIKLLLILKPSIKNKIEKINKIPPVIGILILFAKLLCEDLKEPSIKKLYFKNIKFNRLNKIITIRNNFINSITNFITK